MSKVLEGLLYSESHEWVKVDGDIAVIGVSDFAQEEMGDITYVDLPDVDDEFEKGEEFGALESVKAASDLYCPVSGTVVEVNEALDDEPEKINEDAFGSWIIKVRMSDPSELEGLLDAFAGGRHHHAVGLVLSLLAVYGVVVLKAHILHLDLEELAVLLA